MRRLGAFIALLALSSCLRHASVSGRDPSVVYAPRIRKETQKITHLQKKLEVALQEEKKARNEVERLDLEIHRMELALIRKCVDEYQKQISYFQTEFQKNQYLGQLEASGLFSKEREMLHKIIQESPSPCSFEAQVELDRILRMITEISDSAKK